MRAFLKVIEIHLKIFFRYKWGFFIYFAMRPISILINIALFTSIYNYSNTDNIKSYSLDQMIWYFIAIGFIWVFITNFTDSILSNKIISGDLTMDLLRPIPLLQFEFANAIALRTVGVVMEFLPGILLFSLMFLPKFLTPLSLIKFIFLMIIAFLLHYFMNFLIGLLAFALKNNSSVTAIKGILISFAGGSFIPMEFFPPAFNRVFDLLPFKYLIYWPVQVFLNKESASGYGSFLQILAGQLFWVAVLYILCKISWRSALKKFCVAGG